jgi:preprotein translocase subunit SecA
MDLNEKDTVFKEIDKLEVDRNKELEKVLLEVLPTAFAVVRETARRFKENESSGSYRYRSRSYDLQPNTRT